MKTLNTLSDYARHWATAGINWADQFYDPAYDLLTVPPDADAKHPPRVANAHMVRDSIWYALGLFMRQQDGDTTRAIKIIDAVLHNQFNEPGRVYHGTFRRAPEEPSPPPAHAVEWKDYDPNWREFICSIFLVMMDAYDALLPGDLQQAMWQAIYKAAEGTSARRVPPHYTNISLMSALLMDHAGAHFDVPQWRSQADVLGRAIYALFEANHQTFWEYNSPTYYGVDLFALALWRQYGLNDEVFRMPGAAMEAELWRDIARFYHAGLRNLCGPYDRSYGMDMTHYLATVGLYIGLAVAPDQAPVPDTSQLFGHSGDFLFMPPTAMVGTQIPDDALAHLQAFQGERQFERQVEPGRVASAWLGESVMIGAATAHFVRGAGGDSQCHLATIHWQSPDGGVNWIRVRSDSLFNARAEAGTLTIDCPYATDLRIEGLAAGTQADAITVNSWALPGLTLAVRGASAPQVTTEDATFVIEVSVAETCQLTVQ